MAPSSKTENMIDNKLHGQQRAPDSPLDHRRHYTMLGNALGAMFNHVIAREQSAELRSHLLTMLIECRQEQAPAHIDALLSQCLKAIEESARHGKRQ